MGRKLKQWLEVPILTDELCFYNLDRSVFQYVSARRVQNVYLALHCKIDPRRKNNISVYI